MFSDNLNPSDMKRDQVLATSMKILHAMAEQSKPSVPSLPVLLKSAVNSFEDISEHTKKKYKFISQLFDLNIYISLEWGKLPSTASMS